MPPREKSTGCVLVIVRLGPATATFVGGVPPPPVSESRLLALMAVPSVCEMAVTTAWLVMIVPAGIVSFTRTRNLTAVVAPGASVPPAEPLAPVPRRKTTRGVAPGCSSPWSSATTSVLAPAFAPLTSTSEPGT